MGRLRRNATAPNPGGSGGDCFAPTHNDGWAMGSHALTDNAGKGATTSVSARRVRSATVSARRVRSATVSAVSPAGKVYHVSHYLGPAMSVTAAPGMNWYVNSSIAADCIACSMVRLTTRPSASRSR